MGLTGERLREAEEGEEAISSDETQGMMAMAEASRT